MFRSQQRLAAIAAGGLTGIALLGGVAMAQTPAPTVTPTSSVPGPTAPAAPDGQAAPEHAREDCPEKQAGQSSGANTRLSREAPAGSGV
jgi:hypothetical protein